MALITRYINRASPSGGDGTTNATAGANRAYSSLSEAEAGEVTDLVTPGDSIEFLCTGSTADTSSARFLTGWTTSATSTITIKPQNSDINTTGIYDTGKYRIEISASYSFCVRFASSANHGTIEGLQTSVTGAQSQCIHITSIGVLRALKNICRGDSVSAGQTGIHLGGAAGEYIVANNICYDLAGFGIHKQPYMGSGKLIIYNNTVDSCGTGLRLTSGLSSTSRVFNNLLTNNTTDYNVTGSPSATDNNVTSDATGPNAGHTSKSITYTNAAGKDFSTSDADVVALGTDLRTDPEFNVTEDVIGEARTALTDIGSFQEPTGGGVSLLVNGLNQAQSIDSVTLTQSNVLAVNDLSQAQSIGEPSLTQHNSLSINDLTQNQNIDNVTLVVSGVLQVFGLNQTQSIGIASLVQHNILNVNDVSQSQTIDNITLVDNAVTITAQDLSQSQSVGQPSLTQNNILAVNSLTQNQLIDAVFLGGIVVGYLKGEISVFSAYNSQIQVINALTGEVSIINPLKIQ